MHKIKQLTVRHTCDAYVIFAAVEYLSGKYCVKHLIAGSLHRLEGAYFLLHGIEPLLSLFFVRLNPKPRNLMLQVMVLYMYELHAFLIVSVLVVLAFKQCVHRQKLPFHKKSIYSALVDKEYGKTSEIDKCSYKKYIFTGRTRKRKPTVSGSIINKT